MLTLRPARHAEQRHADPSMTPPTSQAAGIETACDSQPRPTWPTVDPPSPNSASSEMMVARCCDGMRAFSHPCFTGIEMPNAIVETR